MGAGIGFQFDIYDSFIKYIPNGIMEGILLMLVINHLNPKIIIEKKIRITQAHAPFRDLASLHVGR